MKTISLQIAITAILAFFAIDAFSTELKIGAGSAVGEYTNTIVPAIGKKLEPYGYNVVAQVSQGSQQNVEDVASGKLTVALSQWDVAALAIEEGAGTNLTLIGKMAPEALLCAVNKQGRARSLHDFTDRREPPLKVSVGGEKSGTARTFAYLQELDPRLKGLELIHEPDVEAELHRLSSKARDVVCFVMMPNPDNALLKLVADADDLEFIDFVNGKLANAKIGGEKVYDVIEVPVSPGIWGIGAETVNTLVTWAGMIVNKTQADLGLTVLLKSVASEPDLLPPTSTAGKALVLFDKYKVKAEEAANVWVEKAGEAAGEWTEKATRMMNE
jgi:TRAP-type uncharacterized transport system substrate-binding protein